MHLFKITTFLMPKFINHLYDIFRKCYLPLGIILLCSCADQQENKLNIAVASNMQYAVKEILQAFTKQTGIHGNLIVSSSGKLTSQIEHGAPFDIFLSADLKYPNYLHQKKLCVDTPKIYAYGTLALWSQNLETKINLHNLDNSKITNIAIANPKIAPYGRASLEVIESLSNSKKLRNKLIYAENIGQVNQFINTKTTSIGFTALSSIFALPKNKRGKFTVINKQLYKPIAQGIVLINTQNKKQAQLFYNFMLSKKAKQILVKFGYQLH